MKYLRNLKYLHRNNLFSTVFRNSLYIFVGPPTLRPNFITPRNYKELRIVSSVQCIEAKFLVLASPRGACPAWPARMSQEFPLGWHGFTAAQEVACDTESSKYKIGVGYQTNRRARGPREIEQSKNNLI